MTRYRKSNKVIKYKKSGLILCEGQTEENYFKGLVTSDENKRRLGSVNVDIYKPKDHSPKGLINEAKSRIREAHRLKIPLDFVWLVFDRDGHQNIPNVFEEARSSKTKIDIAFTVVCFEYFVLLHFKKTTKAFRNCDELIKDVKLEFAIYEKASNLYEELRPNFSVGIENSKWSLMQCKSDLESGKHPYELSYYSNVHELIEYLQNLK
ncbi:MAG: RloB family protein [Balneolaceae bacterium]